MNVKIAVDNKDDCEVQKKKKGETDTEMGWVDLEVIGEDAREITVPREVVDGAIRSEHSCKEGRMDKYII